jgi:hypothetical protein
LSAFLSLLFHHQRFILVYKEAGKDVGLNGLKRQGCEQVQDVT